MKKKCIFTLLLLISFSSALFADVVDIYHLNTPNLQTAYQHLDGWSPIKRKIDTKLPLTITFHPKATRGFIGTFDTNLYLKADVSLTEPIANLFIKSITISDEEEELYNLSVNKQLSPDSKESILYDENKNILKANDKEIHYASFDLDLKISGRKINGKESKKVYATVDYILNGKPYAYALEYICEPHNFTFNDFITLFVAP